LRFWQTSSLPKVARSCIPVRQSYRRMPYVLNAGDFFLRGPLDPVLEIPCIVDLT